MGFFSNIFTSGKTEQLVRTVCGRTPTLLSEEDESWRQLVSIGDRAVPLLEEAIITGVQGNYRYARRAVGVLQDIGTDGAARVLGRVLHYRDNRTVEMMELYQHVARALVSIDSEEAWVAIRAASSSPAKDYVNVISKYPRARLISNGDGSCRDERSNRTWQEEEDGRMRTIEEARSFCSSLALGGKQDWRLPTAIELKTLAGTPNVRKGEYWADELSGDPFHRHSYVDFTDMSSGTRPNNDVAWIRAVRVG